MELVHSCSNQGQLFLKVSFRGVNSQSSSEDGLHSTAARVWTGLRRQHRRWTFPHLKLHPCGTSNLKSCIFCSKTNRINQNARNKAVNHDSTCCRYESQDAPSRKSTQQSSSVPSERGAVRGVCLLSHGSVVIQIFLKMLPDSARWEHVLEHISNNYLLIFQSVQNVWVKAARNRRWRNEQQLFHVSSN